MNCKLTSSIISLIKASSGLHISYNNPLLCKIFVLSLHCLNRCYHSNIQLLSLSCPCATIKRETLIGLQNQGWFKINDKSMIATQLHNWVSVDFFSETAEGKLSIINNGSIWHNCGHLHLIIIITQSLVNC